MQPEEVTAPPESTEDDVTLYRVDSGLIGCCLQEVGAWSYKQWLVKRSDNLMLRVRDGEVDDSSWSTSKQGAIRKALGPVRAHMNYLLDELSTGCRMMGFLLDLQAKGLDEGKEDDDDG